MPLRGNTRTAPQLVDLVASGVSDPARLITQIEPVDDVLKAYRTFDAHEPSRVKVALRV